MLGRFWFFISSRVTSARLVAVSQPQARAKRCRQIDAPGRLQRAVFGRASATAGSLSCSAGWWEAGTKGVGEIRARHARRVRRKIDLGARGDERPVTSPVVSHAVTLRFTRRAGNLQPLVRCHPRPCIDLSEL